MTPLYEVITFDLKTYIQYIKKYKKKRFQIKEMKNEMYEDNQEQPHQPQFFIFYKNYNQKKKRAFFC